MNGERSVESEQSGAAGTARRRRFLTALIMASGALVGILVAVPVIGFVVGKMFRRPRGVWRSVGAVNKFVVGTTVSVTFEDEGRQPWDGITGHTAAWVRHETEGTFIAFSINCTHLGCPVRWEAEANLFMCPCHGGVYYSDGAVAGGPPPRPLPRYDVRVRKGQVEIKTAPLPISVAQATTVHKRERQA